MIARDESLSSFVEAFDATAGDGPLGDFDISVKANICTREGRTECCSKLLQGYRSPFDATVVEKLTSAGAAIVGKNNMDEFAMGSSGERSVHGPCRNPWDTSRVTGGSSGGSAAAVAAGLVRASLGSDTGGSVRQPAALCGVVGLKPTYGRVSRYGLVAYASSLDQIGPIARSCEDVAVVLGAIAGHDPNDATSSTRGVEDYTARLRESVSGKKIGVPSFARGQGVSAEVARVFDASVEAFRSRGAEIVDVELPSLEYAVPAYYLVATAEASSNLARFDGIRYGRRAELDKGEGLFELYEKSRSEGFGAEVKLRIILGTFALSAGYADKLYERALKVRRLIKDDHDRVFASGIDAILTPTAPSPAFKIGEKTDDPVAMYLEDIFTVSANLAGLPAVSLPAGLAGVDGVTLPVGVQLTGRAWDEAGILSIGAELERCELMGDAKPAVWALG
ncbi:MAG: Asp-tRNA(Asn)/Glu-tRNA(Gln) amidotransferase subunit GatA [Planctomycetota bacterium]